MILISHSDTPQTWFLTSYDAAGPINDALILNGTDQYLDDGDPQTVCRIQWSGNAQALDSYLRLRAVFDQAKPVRVLGLIGTTLPVGTLVNFLVSFGFSYVMDISARVRQMPRGQRGVFVFNDDPPTDGEGAEIVIYNDVDGVASIAPESIFEIGEIWSGDADELEMLTGWSITDVDPIKVSRSVTSRPGRRRTTIPYRRVGFRFDARSVTQLKSGDDLYETMAKIDRGQTCVVFPRYQVGGVYDEDTLNAFAIFGIALQLPGFQHAGGDYMIATGELVVEEVPALPAPE